MAKEEVWNGRTKEKKESRMKQKGRREMYAKDGGLDVTTTTTK